MPSGDAPPDYSRRASATTVSRPTMIGYVIQEVGLFPHFTVARNIGVVPHIEGWPADRIQQRVAELLQLVGLEPQLAARYPRELSGGQRQRVGVARALAADPAFLLMDEPFGALDPITRAELQREFRALQQRLGKTVVFVTHDLREALLLGTRVALMESGQLIVTLKPGEFLNSSDPMRASPRLMRCHCSARSLSESAE